MAERADFTLDVSMPALDGKAAAEVREDGDLVLRGLASDFSIDREGEAFEPGAFQKGIDKFLSGQASLLYHHHNDAQLGQVTSLEAKADGLHFEAIVPRPADSSPLLDIYHKIRRGMMKAVSVRGAFQKRMTPRGPRIYDADIAEISVTPFPINPGALFAVAQKAFDGDLAEPAYEPTKEELEEINRWLQGRVDELQSRFDRLANLLGDHVIRATQEV